MNEFRPPKLNRMVVSIANAVIPFALRSRQVVGVEFDPEDIARLRELKNERLVILPNHPTNTEPAIIFKLGHQGKQAFHYVACRESFDKAWGMWGMFIQRLGAYSLVRGALDRPSFTKTREIIATPKSKLVIFPEGEVYSQNDSLLPFQSGVIQLAFWGLEDAKKKDPDADVKLLPVAVRYSFVEDMKPAILASITRLEEAVGLPIGSPDQAYQRVRIIGEHVVGKLEMQFNLKPSDDQSLNDRVNIVKRTQLERAAEIVRVPLKGGNLAEEMRTVINAVHKVTNDPSQAKTHYDRRLWEESRNHIQPALQELNRLANWIAVYDGYVAANPTSERMVHLLVRMEQEVLGQVEIKGAQKARVAVGKPISLAEWSERYSQDKRGTVAEVTKQSEASVQELLTELASVLPK